MPDPPIITEWKPLLGDSSGILKVGEGDSSLIALPSAVLSH